MKKVINVILILLIIAALVVIGLIIYNYVVSEQNDNNLAEVVTEIEENRLDIVATKFYNTPRYWWVIALANYIIDPFDIPIGTRLRIPPLISLYNSELVPVPTNESLQDEPDDLEMSSESLREWIDTVTYWEESMG